MKAILCGEDPGRLGVKEVDTRGVSSGVSGNISQLCSTKSKPKHSGQQPLSRASIQQQQQQHQEHQQQQSVSAASTPVMSPPMYQPSPALSGSPVSPELVAVPPPNVVSGYIWSSSTSNFLCLFVSQFSVCCRLCPILAVYACSVSLTYACSVSLSHTCMGSLVRDCRILFPCRILSRLLQRHLQWVPSYRWGFSQASPLQPACSLPLTRRMRQAWPVIFSPGKATSNTTRPLPVP